MPKYLDLSAHLDLDVAQLLGRRKAQPVRVVTPAQPIPTQEPVKEDKKATDDFE